MTRAQTHRRRGRAAVLLLSLFLLTASLLPTPVLGANPVIRGVVVQDGLVNPWDVAFLPGGQMVVTERPGRVRIFASGLPNASLLGTTTLISVRAEGESGVMGVAVDHLFRTNRLIYVCASRMYGGQWVNQVIRFKVNTNWTLTQNKYLIATGIRANTIHNGCAVEEGPDQRIWVSTGEANNPMLAQNPSSLNGKILRINRDGSVPADNPIMPGTSKRTFVYSMGHRNPQGIAFMPSPARVYAVEHGPERDDEINWIRPGRNYGWPCRTGYNHFYRSCSGVIGSFTNPVWTSGATTIATSGAAIVNGTVWQDVSRQLFVATLKQSDLRRFSIASVGLPATYRQTYFNNIWGRLRAVVNGPAGTTLYLTTSNGSNDKIIRVIPRSS
ncbi:MAG TPA: PQQ-dependent sugar dehydrogenase [Candidatus Limnocylindria bacterium]|nr:PQQ-dependent sugar dehydrogenase [Candidatus Limnocylindria bacterium]